MTSDARLLVIYITLNMSYVNAINILNITSSTVIYDYRSLLIIIINSKQKPIIMFLFFYLLLFTFNICYQTFNTHIAYCLTKKNFFRNDEICGQL